MKWVVVLIAASAGAHGADLDAIPGTQEKLFAMREKNPESRGANPELTVLKHEIRDWVESRIANMTEKADLSQASMQLNMDLNAVKLTKPDTSSVLSDSRLGEADDVKLEHPRGDSSLLMFTSAVGIDGCGRDVSIYLYDWQDGSWVRRYELERNDYAKDYRPIENVGSVEVSRPDENQQRLVLVMGNSVGCASSWQGFYYSLSRIGSTAKTLMDGSDVVYLGDDDSYEGRLEPNGFLIEHLGNSQDEGVLIRRHVLHYTMDHDTVERVEPIALTPRDFVDEWLSREWDEIAEWSEPRLKDWHDELKSEGFGDFQLIQRCSDNASHWEIEFDFEDDEKYFLVEQRGEHSFRMIDITDEQLAGCPGGDEPRTVGDSYPTLFPTLKKQ